MPSGQADEQTWRLRYKKHGFTAICPRERSDKGKTRKITPERLLEAIEQIKPYFRGGHFNLTELYRRCIEKGLLRREQIAPNTFRRLVKQFELLTPELEIKSKKRLAFAKAHANEAWQSDTLFGPRVKKGQRFIQSKLIAFIDDASRICCHGEFFAEENSPAFKTAFKKALYKRGLPQMLYVDNGSIYSTAELSAICARLGIRLYHTPVRDGAAKGKIERFFRTVRDQFLIRELDLSSIEALNNQFIAWAERRSLQPPPPQHPGHETDRTLRTGPRAHPIPSPQSIQRRTLHDGRNTGGLGGQHIFL